MYSVNKHNTLEVDSVTKHNTLELESITNQKFYCFTSIHEIFVQHENQNNPAFQGLLLLAFWSALPGLSFLETHSVTADLTFGVLRPTNP